jgi:rubrerythrin
MYKRMAEEAREEGLDDIAFLFESVGNRPVLKPC